MENSSKSGITAALGFRAGAVSAHLRYQSRLDLALIVSQVPAAAAGVFTQNKVLAAPVVVSKEHLEEGILQAIVVNAGISNAATGEQGLADARKMTQLTAAALNLDPEQVAVASTGVIGVKLPMDRVAAGIAQAAAQLDETNGLAAAQAIMTTDTRSKECSQSFTLEDQTVTIGGMAKGSGMIHPNMATLLAFITTDLAISRELLQQALSEAVDQSFNAVTIDGDTSTNDTLLILANGQAGNPPITAEGPAFQIFQEHLNQVTQYLAREIARDGEGATHLIEVRVRNAATKEAGRKIAKTIAGSSLVKAAVYGRDANWGRILCAAGYADAVFDPQKVDIWLGEVMVAQQGAGLEFDEEAAKKVLDRETVIITLDLGESADTPEVLAFGCDLTHDYVDINASYRS